MGTVADDLAARWFVHECVLHQDANASPYGPQDDDGLPFKGFVRQRTNRVDTPTGQSLVTDTTVSAPLSLPAEEGDEVDLPAPFGGRWEITARAVNAGVPGLSPDHMRLTLTAAHTPGGGPYTQAGGPYG